MGAVLVCRGKRRTKFGTVHELLHVHTAKLKLLQCEGHSGRRSRVAAKTQDRFTFAAWPTAELSRKAASW